MARSLSTEEDTRAAMPSEVSEMDKRGAEKSSTGASGSALLAYSSSIWVVVLLRAWGGIRIKLENSYLLVVSQDDTLCNALDMALISSDK